MFYLEESTNPILSEIKSSEQGAAHENIYCFPPINLNEELMFHFLQ